MVGWKVKYLLDLLFNYTRWLMHHLRRHLFLRVYFVDFKLKCIRWNLWLTSNPIHAHSPWISYSLNLNFRIYSLSQSCHHFIFITRGCKFLFSWFSFCFLHGFSWNGPHIVTYMKCFWVGQMLLGGCWIWGCTIYNWKKKGSISLILFENWLYLNINPGFSIIIT